MAKKIKSGWIYFSILLYTLFANLAHGALQPQVNPQNNPAAGNIIKWLEGWIGDGADTVALAVSATGFFWVGWIVLSKFNDTRSSKEPDWGSFGLTALVGSVVLIFLTYLMTQAVGII